MKIRVGFGFDVHQLVPGRELWLGGIRFEHELGLLGHSDADVLTHALMDALLGAAGLWDIGHAFPDTDAEEYYWVDLIGCTLYGEHDGQSILLGVVHDITDNGAHAVLHVKRQALDENGAPVALRDDKGRDLESLVPFVSAHVHTVDLANRRLESNWPVDF